MNTVTAGLRSFSPPFKSRYADIPGGGEWSPYNKPHHAEYRPSYPNGTHGSNAVEMGPLKKSAGKTPAHHSTDDSSPRLDTSKLFEDVPMSHKSFLDPEYEAEMLKHKRDVLQSVVDSHGTDDEPSLPPSLLTR